MSDEVTPYAKALAVAGTMMTARSTRPANNIEIDTPVDDGDLQEKDAKKSAATVLVEIGASLYTFGISDDGETFAVPVGGPKVVSMMRGSKTSLRGQLAKVYFKKFGRAAPQQALADALLVLDGMAQEADPMPLYLRVATAGDQTWIDLGDTTGRAIRVSSTEWSIESQPPVLFKRTALMSPLPVPEVGGDLDLLWQRLNVTTDDRAIIVAWLVAALMPGMPHPILTLSGEQGTGKSNAQRTVVSCIDPSPVPLRKPPRDPESWITAAAGSWVVGLDNLSVIPDWLSDSLCRAVTGDGDVRRKLYTDGEHAVFAFQRCIILNSIDLGSTRGDLSERMLPIMLETIPDHRRATEAELWGSWERDHPKILGAVLASLARVKHLLPSVELETKPRMADFALVLAAVDLMLNTKGLEHYLEKQGALAADSLTGDPLVAAIADKCKAGFEGTAAELLHHLDVERPPKGWPQNARVVTQRLRRHSPAMRKAGWTVSNDGGANKFNVARWVIRPEFTRISSSPSSPSSPKPEMASQASQARHKYGPTTYDCPSCDGEGCGYCR